MKRVLVAAETLKGRYHATWGIEWDDGRVSASRRTLQSLCGVPVKSTGYRFVLDNSEQGCKACNNISENIDY